MSEHVWLEQELVHRVLQGKESWPRGPQSLPAREPTPEEALRLGSSVDWGFGIRGRAIVVGNSHAHVQAISIAELCVRSDGYR